MGAILVALLVLDVFAFFSLAASLRDHLGWFLLGSLTASFGAAAVIS